MKTILILLITISIGCLIGAYIYYKKAKKAQINAYQEQLWNFDELTKKAQVLKKNINQDQKKLDSLSKEIDNKNKTKDKLYVEIKNIEKNLKTQQANSETITNLMNEKQGIYLNLLEKIDTLEKKNNSYLKQEKEKIEQQLKNFKECSRIAAQSYFDNLEKVYETADAAHAEKMAKLKEDQDAAAAALNTLKETRKAAYEAVLKQKEIKANKDNYCLLPSVSDLQDIHSLEKIKTTLHKPRVLSMLIWQTFWQPLAKKQFPIILKDKTKMGIYKITNIQTNQAYIGQSTDVYTRWCSHCKAGLGIDAPVGNKLYKAMQEYGLQNFTFELISQCPKQELDEKEKYFIELYQADLFGYNSTKGNK